MSVPAFAAWSDYGTELTSAPAGLWDVTYLYSSAGGTDTFSDGTSLLDNKANTVGDTITDVDLSKAYFTDVSTSTPSYALFDDFSSVLGDVKVYSITTDVTVYFEGKSYSFLAGDLILAFDDCNTHVDYNDFVLVARAATPIPGAAWLLGSGLIGLVGLRRKMKI